jgi:hypothetical protein
MDSGTVLLSESSGCMDVLDVLTSGMIGSRWHSAKMYESPQAALMASCYTSSHSTELMDPSYFSIPNDLK